jgi:hypothetical protein
MAKIAPLTLILVLSATLSASAPFSDGPAVGTLRLEAFGGELPTSLSATVRTTSPGGAGVSWTGVPSLDTLRGDSFVPWLVESARDRTNLGLVNLSGPTTSFRIEIHDGETGRLVATHLTKVLGRDEFLQLSSVLRDLAPSVRRGWARVVPAIPSSYFLAYGVVMDGAEPGLGTDDGTFVLGHPE